MGYRNIIISSARTISIRNAQLQIDDISVPVEDINSVLVENQYLTVSSYVLQTLSDKNVVVFFCDRKHLPTTVVLPIVKHSRHYKMLMGQINCGKPLKKRMWQSIVKAKIDNQARCLSLIGDTNGAKYMLALEQQVLSGDTRNTEARAAAYYFKRLFGQSYVRSEDNLINSCLNYGYAIARGAIARSIVCHGFEPALGLFHRSELNNYNLADDFIEPIRPLIDLLVFNLVSEYDGEVLSPEMKRSITSLFIYDMEVEGKKQIFSNSVELMIESYSRSISNSENLLVLPTLILIHEHSYE